jgi:tripartite-type tricarboxylate transporter receptor subunit TctC
MKARAGCIALVLCLFPKCVLHAQTYPSKPIRIIVSTSPGVAQDTAARVIAQPLSARLGRQIIVENRPGAGTIIGTELVVKAAPDGYTLLMTPPSLAINPAMYRKMSYDALRDLASITQVCNSVNILVVHPSLPAKSVRELIALAKSRPGELVFASGGTGSSTHLAMELFMLSSATRMMHVPYKGSAPAIIDLIAGRVSVMLPGMTIGAPHVRAGRLRALGVSSSKRSMAMPDVPTIAESGGISYEAVAWTGLLSPAGTANEIIGRLHQEVVAILHTNEVTERLAKDGMEVIGSSPDEFAAFIRSETTKWAEVVKRAGIQAA